jgi:hypothetical protein
MLTSIISLILWFALLGSGAWFLVKPRRTDPHGVAYGDYPALPSDALGHFGDGV